MPFLAGYQLIFSFCLWIARSLCSIWDLYKGSPAPADVEGISSLSTFRSCNPLFSVYRTFFRSCLPIAQSLCSPDRFYCLYSLPASLTFPYILPSCSPYSHLPSYPTCPGFTQSHSRFATADASRYYGVARHYFRHFHCFCLSG